MGGVSSITITQEQTEEELTDLMMPPYYIKDVVVDDDDIILARISWRMIIEGSSPAFNAIKSTPEFECSSCLTWFYDSFYKRLFDVNPSARPLFKNNIQSQGRVLMGIISTALNQLRDPDSFAVMLVSLAHVHSKRGVRGMQYGIIGDVLFWTLSLCLGDAYDPLTAIAWHKIFSYMLKIIVPVAVDDEIQELKASFKPTIQQPSTQSAKESKSGPLPTSTKSYTFTTSFKFENEDDNKKVSHSNQYQVK